MKTIKLFSFCLLFSAITLVSCKPNNKKDHKSNSTEVSQMKDSSDVEDAEKSGLTENAITKNEDQYPRDIKLFEDEEIMGRIKAITGDAFDDISKNFNVETPIVSVDGIYKFTGCKEHDCPAFQTTVLYDANTDNFNVLVSKNGAVKVYKEKEAVTMNKELKMK